MTADRGDIFFARWVLFIVIVTPLSILVFSLLQMQLYLVWMIPILPSPWLIFFKDDLIKIFQDWYSLIRGEDPKKRFDSFQKSDDNA